tara:strand:- start:8715 stop:9614 length:900 start_codon:yes stop_codon:yes gene_type:complete
MNNKLYVLIIFLVIAIIAISVSFYNYTETSELKLQETENLRILKLEEENNLRSELDDILEQYDNSREEIDNLNIDLYEKQLEIDNLKKEIRDLLNVKNDLNQAKQKIIKLQNISKKYFAQVDSLLGKTEELQIQNQTLEEENILLKNKNQEQNKELLEQNERLNIGSTLEVFDIEIDKLKLTSYGQERKVIWAKNIQLLRSCFKISANQIAISEPKTVYIQYIDPNGKLLQSSSSPDNSFFTIKDSIVEFTISKLFNYNNEELELCVDWQRGETLESGRYKILFYIEEKLVGNTILKLN